MNDYLDVTSRGIVYRLNTEALIALIPCRNDTEVQAVLKTVPQYRIADRKTEAAA